MWSALVALLIAAAATPSAAASDSPASSGLTPSEFVPSEAGPRTIVVPRPLVVAPDAAEIINSGSTNTPGYHVVVSPSGAVQATVGGGPLQRAAVSRDLANRLFADLAAAPALPSLATGRCMKSASFGSSTMLRWHGAASGDVSCGGDERTHALATDVRAIVTAAGLDLHGRRRYFFGSPRPPEPESSGAAAPI